VNKRVIIGAGKYLFGFALLGLVLWWYWEPSKGNPGIKDALSTRPYLAPLFLAMVLNFAGLLVTFLRWYILVRAQDLPFTLPNAFRLGFVGYFFNTCLPGSIGGDIVKAWSIAREQSRRTVAVATVIVDRVIGLWGLMWLAAISGTVFWIMGNQAIVANSRLRAVFFLAVASSVLSYLFWLVLGFLPDWRAQRFADRLDHWGRVGHSAAEFWRAIWMYRCRGRIVLYTVLMSLVCHVAFVLAFFFAAQVFQTPGEEGRIPTVTQHFLLIPIGMTVEAVPLSPGGVGVSEVSYGWLYSLADAPEANGIMAMLAKRFIQICLAAVGGLIYLNIRPALKPAIKSELSMESHSAAAPSRATLVDTTQPS
jgi:glycosyltransferase 2 family protein